MSISPSDINYYGDELYSALVDLRTVASLRDRVPGIDINDAYRIQSRMVLGASTPARRSSARRSAQPVPLS